MRCKQLTILYYRLILFSSALLSEHFALLFMAFLDFNSWQSEHKFTISSQIFTLNRILIFCCAQPNRSLFLTIFFLLENQCKETNVFKNRIKICLASMKVWIWIRIGWNRTTFNGKCKFSRLFAYFILKRKRQDKTRQEHKTHIISGFCNTLLIN